MAESTVGGDKQKGKKNLVWTTAMDDCLINVMLDLAKNNQYQNGSFRPGTYHEMEKQLILLDPGCGVKVNPNIVSRVKTLKRKFNGVKELRGLSGAGWNATQEKEKGQTSVSSRPRNKRRRVDEAEVESTSIGKELLDGLKPIMEVFTTSLGDALRGEAVVEQEPVQDELVKMRNGIQDELEKIHGLTPIEKMQAALILVDNVPKLGLFYRQKDEARELFVKCLLGKF
ncbi:hypothetical protein LINGRAHAP2_LOCUS23115 [Linum grandiflorum]